MTVDVQHAVEDDEADLNVTINTTPLVDVMLVMLIIFLVTIPVVLKTVNVQLPTYRNIVTATKPENIVIAVTTDEQTYYDNEPVDQQGMKRKFVEALKRAQAANKPRSAYPRRQGCAFRGHRPRHLGLSTSRYPESGLHHRTPRSGSR